MRIHKSAQQGMMLLESLIGLLIFSLGILALIGMQANAIRDTTETKYRSDASFLASRLAATIWTDRANYDDYLYNGTGTAPSKLDTWIGQLKNTLPGLDAGSSSFPSNGLAPKITEVATISGTTELAIELHWQLPGSDVIRQYRTTIFINN